MIKKIILRVKPFQETLHADMCGPASLKIVLDFYGLKKSEKEVTDIVPVVKGIGWGDKEITRVAKSLGLKVKVKNNSTFSDIEKWLRKGVPVIVDWLTKGRSDYDDSEVADGHYSVVIGLDDKYIYLQDPETGGERKLTKEDFMRVWFDFTGLYIKPSELVIRQLIAVYF
jgi:ABC-type bacteriocin/lantibiotic exporter with double-glycine peptidase domain